MAEHYPLRLRPERRGRACSRHGNPGASRGRRHPPAFIILGDDELTPVVAYAVQPRISISPAPGCHCVQAAGITVHDRSPLGRDSAWVQYPDERADLALAREPASLELPGRCPLPD